MRCAVCGTDRTVEETQCGRCGTLYRPAPPDRETGYGPPPDLGRPPEPEPPSWRDTRGRRPYPEPVFAPFGGPEPHGHEPPRDRPEFLDSDDWPEDEPFEPEYPTRAEPPGPERGRRSRRLLVVLAIVALAGVATTAFVFALAGGSEPAPDPAPEDSVAADVSGRPGTDPVVPDVVLPPPPGADPGSGSEPPSAEGSPGKEQALAVDELLDGSEPSRGALGPAIGRVRRCEEAGTATIERVTEERGEQLALAETLTVDALAGGEELKERLIRVFRSSKNADEGYLAWARRFVAGGCAGEVGADPDYRRGEDASREAVAAKRDFVELWNPIAEREGLKPRSAAEI
ncbi:hypothetical protein [Rhizohabitans arisaemae]|uniref:hypothetical protein n=1 Tax=Rhizohabitans arisaemae TaxID=2720610 RepID=UPI0024B1036E|nr:hypothetical protein [Rhizohabitans arisaemae]